MISMDFNADIGEGFGRWRMGDDNGLLEIVSSANVACGFHAGDPMIMRDVCQRAADNGVTIGAHVGFRDLVGFGRRELPIAGEDLRAESLYQIGALDGFARRAGTRVKYVKPHGALYHAASNREELAAAIVDAMVDHGSPLVLLGAAGSYLEKRAVAAGVPFASEGFADRAYSEAGTLVPRSEAGAVHTDVQVMIDQVRSLVFDRSVTSVKGNQIPLEVDSICLHGDTPGALNTGRKIRESLLAEGVILSPFVS